MSDKTQLYGAHPESPTAVLCSCAPKLAEFAQRIATLEALVNEQHTPTINEHDDRLDDAEGSLERHEIRLDRHESSLTRIGLVMDSIERNTRLLIDHFKIADSAPKPTPRER